MLRPVEQTRSRMCPRLWVGKLMCLVFVGQSQITIPSNNTEHKNRFSETPVKESHHLRGNIKGVHFPRGKTVIAGLNLMWKQHERQSTAYCHAQHICRCPQA